ncbi:MAG: hypothetical protein JWN79_2619 [Gemmatimonadetes bacterium]|jgi:hypothetical protein|nr:hypothetical protein [Gemmatimonadota bacterium]
MTSHFETTMSTRSSIRIGACLATLVLAGSAAAQQRPAARPLGPALATSEPLVALSAVRALPGGRVLVNDPGSRRVLLLDSMLKVLRVVADSTPSTANAYGARPGGLLAYRGDSSLFVDPASLSMLVIDPEGQIARVMAAPRPNDVFFLVGGPLGNPGFDARGRLIYRTLARNFGGAPPQPGQPMPAQPDSSPLVRFDLATRTLDTAAFIRTPAPRMNVVQTERGMSVSMVINPMTVMDDWAVLPDGSLAIMRGRDYHLDVIATDGTRTAGETLAFDWQRLGDDDKVRILDSARTAMEAVRARGAGVSLNGAPSGVVGAGGGERIMITTTVDGPGGARTTIGGAPPAGATLPPLVFVQPSELPDYRPAFSGGAMRGDREGRVWVRTIPTKPLAGGPEYDVIARDGRLVERVAIPAGTTIVGFGEGGIVFLGVRDAAGTHLVRARMK